MACLDDIAGTASTKEKQRLLNEYRGVPLFARVVRAALDPFVTYGLAKIPDPAYDSLRPRISPEFSSHTWVILYRLASRELSGSAAKREVAFHLGDLSVASAELLKRVLTKDLRAGFGATLCNKIESTWVPVFDCMLAYPYAEKRVRNWPVAVETKLDGFRALAFIDCRAGVVRMLTRSGKEYTSFEHLKPELLRLGNKLRFGDEALVVFDGEAVSGSFNQTASEVRKKDVQCVDAVYHVFDVLPGSVFTSGSKAKQYMYRRQDVERLPKDGTVRQLGLTLAYGFDEITKIYERNREQGLEGVIVKMLDGVYSLKRSYDWMKIKAEETLDLRVVGAFEGTGKYLGRLGGLTVDYEGVKVNVGSGFSDEQREEFWNAYGCDTTDNPRLKNSPSVLLGRTIEVQYHEVTPDGSLRHPRFVRFRGDKE
jgi:hypothetical protein